MKTMTVFISDKNSDATTVRSVNLDNITSKEQILSTIEQMEEETGYSRTIVQVEAFELSNEIKNFLEEEGIDIC